MKKIILTGCVGVAMMFMGNANAQGFYAEISGGYGWGLGENQLGVEQYTDVTLQGGAPVMGEGSYTRAINGTVGSGLNVTLTPGYMITEHLGVELGINYFKGSVTTMEDKFTGSPDQLGYGKTTAYSNQVRIMPTLVFNTGGETLYGYSKVGLVMPVAGSTVGIVDAYTSTVIPNQMTKVDVDTKTNGKLSIGFRGSVGVGYNITDMISVNAEVFYTSLHVSAKHREYRTYEVAGNNQLDGAPTYASEINYVNELNGTSNNIDYINDMSKLDLDKPMDDMMAPTNFSQLGIQVGVKFNF